MRMLAIGFTKKCAQRFFELLRAAGVKRVVDVRLNNASQLAGFAKRDDLAWLLGEICDKDYQHLPALAPTKDMLAAYRKANIDWPTYWKRIICCTAFCAMPTGTLARLRWTCTCWRD